jgi:predicted permease
MSAEEVRDGARHSLGNPARIEKEARDVWLIGWLETLMQDVRYALRQFRQSPVLTAVVVLSLALGMGANTAIFSLMDTVMLKTLPVKAPEELVVLGWLSKEPLELVKSYITRGGCPVPGPWGQTGGCSFSYPRFEQISRATNVFSGVAAFLGLGAVNLVANGQANVVEAQGVSGDYFSTLGVRPVLGRLLARSDDTPGAPPAAVLSFSCWERFFGRDPAIVGRAVKLNGVAFTVVGVTPPEFFGVEPGWSYDVWIPASLVPGVEPFYPRTSWKGDADWRWNVIARLKPGVSWQRARAEAELLFQQGLPSAGKASRSADSGLQHSQPQASHPHELPRLELAEGSKGLALLRRQFSRPLFILWIAVGLVLLIACANVANLLLARVIARGREIAVRMALGAGRRRLFRQTLTESILLAALGGTAGTGLAYWADRWLVLAFSSGYLELLRLDVRPDLRVLGFTALASLLTGVLFGLAPALRGTRVDLTPALKGGSGSFASKPGHLRLGKLLVMAQVGLSLVLLTGALLFVRTLANLERLDTGFDRRNILLFSLDASTAGYRGDRLKGFYQELQERLASLPGVLNVSLSNMPLIGGGYMEYDITIPGYRPRTPEETAVRVLNVGPRFFETMGIRTLLGRTIEPRDNQGAPKVAVINRALADHYFPGINPVGRKLAMGGQDLIEIVGVVANAKYQSLRESAEPTVYLPYLQQPVVLGMTFELRTAAKPLALASSVRRLVQSMDPNLPLLQVRTQEEQISRSLFEERIFAQLSSLFGLLALVLACIGLYGVMAYAVRRRTNEIGIRMALGAERGQVLRMILKETGLLAVVGIAIGVPLALAATQLVKSMVFGLKPHDPLTLAGTALLLLLVSLAAGYVPARRAASVDPSVALRYE